MTTTDGCALIVSSTSLEISELSSELFEERCGNLADDLTYSSNDQAYWQRAVASKPATAVKAFTLGGCAWFAGAQSLYSEPHHTDAVVPSVPFGSAHGVQSLLSLKLSSASAALLPRWAWELSR